MDQAVADPVATYPVVAATSNTSDPAAPIELAALQLASAQSQ